MLYPAVSCANLTEAVILIVASLFTFKKLYQGSKSKFAYLLTAFAFADAFNRLAIFVALVFPN